MRLRWASSSMNSERSRIRVIGVRRSWLMAASILVRSSIRPVMRSRMRLSAFATERISSGPRSGSGAAPPFRLKLSAALANDDSGAVSARAAHRPSRVTLMTANSSVIIQGLPRTAAAALVRQDVGRNHRAVGQHDAELARRRRRREREDAIVCAEAALQAVQVGLSGFARRRRRPRRQDLRCRAAERRARYRRTAAAARTPAPRRATARPWRAGAWPRSDDGSGWSGRCIRKLAVMIRCSATIETTTSAAIWPLMPRRFRKPSSFMVSGRRRHRLDADGFNARA